MPYKLSKFQCTSWLLAAGAKNCKISATCAEKKSDRVFVVKNDSCRRMSDLVPKFGKFLSFGGQIPTHL